MSWCCLTSLPRSSIRNSTDKSGIWIWLLATVCMQNCNPLQSTSGEQTFHSRRQLLLLSPSRESLLRNSGMSLLRFLVTGFALCVSDEAKPEESSKLATEETQGKVNLMWMAVLYPNIYEHLYEGSWTYAACEVKPSALLEAGKPQLRGQVLFKQIYPHGKLMAIFYLDGFPAGTNPSGTAIHIHELGDLSKGCDSTGGHYNPFKVHHPLHPGDFGNFYPKGGKIRILMVNLPPTLYGPQAVIGRSVVIHENRDDLGKGNNTGSLEHGNAGKRLACCVIGHCKKEIWRKAYEELLKIKD